MGSGRSSADDLQRQFTQATASGAAAFGYDRYAKQTGADVHQILNIMNGRIRESAHPDAVQIIVVVDQTGSNRSNPIVIRNHIAKLLGLLTLQGYVPHPAIQLVFMGDSRSDQYYIQISEFESAIEQIEEILTAVVLEGNGGGQRREDYGEVALALMDKDVIRNDNKTFVFFIGDEMPYEVTESWRMKHYYGIVQEGDFTREEIFTELRTWCDDNLFLIRCVDTQHFHSTEILSVWKQLLPAEHILTLDNAENVCDLIAGTVGFNMGVPIATLNNDLDNSATMALAPLYGSNAIEPRQQNKNIRRLR